MNIFLFFLFTLMAGIGGWNMPNLITDPILATISVVFWGAFLGVVYAYITKR